MGSSQSKTLEKKDSQNKQGTDMEEEDHTDEDYAKSVKMKKDELEQKIASLEDKDSSKLDLWLSIIASTLKCNPLRFDSLRQAIDNSCELQNFFDELNDLGITKKLKFKKHVKKLVILHQQQWVLLQETVEKLYELANKCEDCELAVKVWKREVHKKINQENYQPKTTRIEESMKELNGWLSNHKIVESLLAKWTKFKEDVENFKVDWDPISSDVRKEIENQIKDQSFWEKYKFNIGLAGGATFGVGIGYALAHVLVIVPGVAFTVIGILGAALIIGGVTYLAHKKYSNHKLKKLEEKHHKMLKSIDDMTKKLQGMIVDSSFIQQRCHELDICFKNQISGNTRIGTWIKPDMLDDLEKQLNKIEKSLTKFRVNCEKTAEYILETQRRIAGVS